MPDRVRDRTRRRRVVSERHPDVHDRVDVAESGIEAARSQFGGLDLAASLTGMLVAIAMILILGGLIAAAVGTIAFEGGIAATDENITIGSLIAGLVTLFVAFLVGGWAAGRMARYDGGVNGLMTAVWFLILTAIFAGLGLWIGEQYNVFVDVEMPNWMATWLGTNATTGAVIGGIVAVLVSLLGGLLGGTLGARYHRAADATIAATSGVTSRYVEEDGLVDVGSGRVVDLREEDRPLSDWSDEDLLDERRVLLRTDQEDVELSRRAHSLEEIESELERRGYDPAAIR
jgi:hypothetical protein